MEPDMKIIHIIFLLAVTLLSSSAATAGTNCDCSKLLEQCGFRQFIGQFSIEALADEAGAATGDVHYLAHQVGVYAQGEIFQVQVDVVHAGTEFGGKVITQVFGIQVVQIGARLNEAAAGLGHLLPVHREETVGMNGGVWEWVSDCWNNSHQGAPGNGRSREADDCRVRVIRGGSWRNDKSYVTSTSRFKYDANVRYLLNGFRVARTLP